MNRTVRTIIAILIGLVIVVVIAGLAFMAFTRWNTGGWMMDGRAWGDWRNQPWGGMPWGGMPMHSRWFGGFFPLAMIFGRLLQLGILALVIYGIYALIRGLTRPQVTTSAQIAQASPLPATPVMAAATHPCASCGFAVQDGWKHCPNCGQAQAS
jgi:uncharacterized membrane protein